MACDKISDVLCRLLALSRFLERHDVLIGLPSRCGSCGSTADFGRDDVIRCRSCGHRILYKTRLKRPVQYEAR